VTTNGERGGGGRLGLGGEREQRTASTSGGGLGLACGRKFFFDGERTGGENAQSAWEVGGDGRQVS
jgi:hypothetical protein